MIIKINDENGYTLLEIIIVAIIIALISAVALPSVGQLRGRTDLERTVQTMVSDFHLAQQTAVAYSKNCRIEFFPNGDRYRMRLPGETRMIRLPEGIRIVANNFPVYWGTYRMLSFNRNGAPNQGGTISLTNKHGDELFIIIFLASGRIRISEEPPANW